MRVRVRVWRNRTRLHGWRKRASFGNPRDTHPACDSALPALGVSKKETKDSFVNVHTTFYSSLPQTGNNPDVYQLAGIKEKAVLRDDKTRHGNQSMYPMTTYVHVFLEQAKL